LEIRFRIASNKIEIRTIAQVACTSEQRDPSTRTCTPAAGLNEHPTRRSTVGVSSSKCQVA
jgi:hypothetical protein